MCTRAQKFPWLFSNSLLLVAQDLIKVTTVDLAGVNDLTMCHSLEAADGTRTCLLWMAEQRVNQLKRKVLYIWVQHAGKSQTLIFTLPS